VGEEDYLDVAKRIVVGVDGSLESMKAVEWAVWEAKQVGASVEIVHVDVVDDSVLEHLDYTKRIEREVLTASVRHASAWAPELAVTGHVMGPPTIDSLLDRSQDALMLVVGSRGLGSLRSLVLGSVSQACATRAKCPVVIVSATATLA